MTEPYSLSPLKRFTYKGGKIPSFEIMKDESADPIIINSFNITGKKKIRGPKPPLPEAGLLKHSQ